MPTARVPWDDRQALDADLSDLRAELVRSFLRAAGSSLHDEPDRADIYRRMRITRRSNGHELPRNVGLLFFSHDPERWFPGARIEVVSFPGGATGDALVEKVFNGGLEGQIRSSSTYLGGLMSRLIRKHDDRIRASSSMSYPKVAWREALANAVHHRGYEADFPEPTKVYLYPDRMEITSYPGPVPGIEAEHFAPGAPAPSAPARNRRIGELLKEAGLAERRLTGITKIFEAMAWNGSPPPTFDFDAGRTYFRVTLPKHEEHVGL